MARDKLAFDVGLLSTSYGRIGETGKIVDADRRVAVSLRQVSEQVGFWLIEELQRTWPEHYTVSEIENTPRRIILTITVERKGVKLYGTK